MGKDLIYDYDGINAGQDVDQSEAWWRKDITQSQLKEGNLKNGGKGMETVGVRCKKPDEPLNTYLFITLLPHPCEVSAHQQQERNMRSKRKGSRHSVKPPTLTRVIDALMGRKNRMKKKQSGTPT